MLALCNFFGQDFHINPAWHQVVPNLFPLGPPVAGEVECGKNARVEDLHPARVEDLHCSVHCTLEVSELPFECSLAGADLLASNLVPSRNFPQKNMWQKLRSCGVYLRIICLLSDRLCMKMRAQHAGKHGMFHLILERFINWKLKTKTTKERDLRSRTLLWWKDSSTENWGQRQLKTRFKDTILQIRLVRDWINWGMRKRVIVVDGSVGHLYFLRWVGWVICCPLRQNKMLIH